MTPDELNTRVRRIYSTLIRERRMRETVFPPGHAKRDTKLSEIDGAIAALEELTVWGRLHTEEPPEQVALIDDVPSVQLTMCRVCNGEDTRMEATRERPAPAMAYGVFNRPPRPECRLERSLAGDYLLQQWRHERWVTLARLERCDDMWFIRSKDDAVTCLWHDDEEDAIAEIWGTRWDYMGHHPFCECDVYMAESDALAESEAR